jgi:DnaJ like chaperone protein
VIWRGKIIGMLLGALTLKPPAIILGLFIGHLFDRSSAKSKRKGSSGKQQQKLQQSFFQTSFLFLGYLSKSSGRVLPSEIDYAQRVMSDMGLDEAGRQHAIALFTKGKSADFSPVQTIKLFKKRCGHQPTMVKLFLEIQIGCALAQQPIQASEQKILQFIAARLNFTSFGLEMMIQKVIAEYFFQQNYSAQSTQSQVAQAYSILELPTGSDLKEVKRAYRKLMSQHHPDKLIAKNMPDEMKNLAKERVQEIQQAYEVLTTHFRKG